MTQPINSVFSRKRTQKAFFIPANIFRAPMGALQVAFADDALCSFAAKN
jgi:hypothetical protein